MSAKHLSPSFFHCPPLTRNEKQRFKELGIASAYELAEKAQISGGPMQWELDSNEHELKIYVGNVAEDECSSTPHLSTITVRGTMSEVLDLFRFQTTEEAKEYCRRFGTVSDDAVNLYSIVSVTPEAPHEWIGISWHGFKNSIVDKVLPRRDACLLIVHHAFEFNGKNVWVRCLKSIDVPCCPESPGFVRMTLYSSGYVVTESDRPGFVDVAFVTHANVGGHLGEYASWFIDMSSRKRCRHLTAIDRFLREDRLSKTPFLKPDEAKSAALASVCSLCQRRFGPFSKKTNCLKCGEVCCRRCVRLWHVKNRGFDAKANVCTKCALGNLDSENSLVWLRASRRNTEGSYYGSEGSTTPLSRSMSNLSPRLDLFELVVESKAWTRRSNNH